MSDITQESKKDNGGGASPRPLTYVLRSLKMDKGRLRVTLGGIIICVALLIVFLSLSSGMEEHMDEDRSKYDEISYVLEQWVTVLAWLISVLLAVIVANSLLVSVYRRKKEIATLMALGISRSGIVLLVFIEGLVITFFSYVIGVGVGLILALVNDLILDSSGEVGFFLPSAIGFDTIFISLAICLGITLLASVFPAIAISRIDPIKELRYE